MCQHELTLRLALGAPLIATKGYAAPEVEARLRPARELCQQVGKTAHRFRYCRACGRVTLSGLSIQIAHELAQELLTTPAPARACASPPARRARGGRLHLYLGRWHSPHIFEQGICLYDPHNTDPHCAYGVDPGVFASSFAALTLWLHGYPNHASHG